MSLARACRCAGGRQAAEEGGGRAAARAHRERGRAEGDDRLLPQEAAGGAPSNLRARLLASFSGLWLFALILHVQVVGIWECGSAPLGISSALLQLT
eukprot:3142515-Pleurochrysis_carterae.AAC.1